MATSRIIAALAAASAAELAVSATLGIESCMLSGKGYNDGMRNSTPNGGTGILDPGVCQQSCENMVFCDYWTWYNNTGGCWLQGINSTLDIVDEGVVSGTTACVKDARAAAAAAANSTGTAGAMAKAAAQGEEVTVVSEAASANQSGTPVIVTLAWILASIAGAACVGCGGYVLLGGLDSTKEKSTRSAKTDKSKAKETARDLEMSDPSAAPLMPARELAPAPATYVQPMYGAQSMPLAQPMPMVSVALPTYTSASAAEPGAAGMAATCPACGNIFAPDALFCRKCGQARPGSTTA
eukprot:TRINITY_DN77220_c0_g1_i1.p1 TRINITY_DN77220_c0_g1~~TRINITY_DN77220_c0_g1_i1.p1  ORF type:complete len:296 (+),score=53.60 TRINITY_DN77220_c0_g1_i1:115-1002(+)